MSPFWIPILAISIPIFAMAFKAFSKWMELKERQMTATNSLTAEKTAQYAAHTERLEQRVRVLERILTDRGMAVAEEIEALRDPPAPKTRADLLEGDM